MPIETERKYLDVDFDELRPELVALGARMAGIRFETNILLDDVTGSCKRLDRVVRVRVMEKPGLTQGIFTIKWPLKNETASAQAIKVREELEIEIDQPDRFVSMLGLLGYKPELKYEKIRESWLLDHTEGLTTEQVRIELDLLPFCMALEIEGSIEAIKSVSRLLDLDKYKISTISYTRLYQEFSMNSPKDKNLKLTFEPSVKKALRHQMGLV